MVKVIISKSDPVGQTAISLNPKFPFETFEEDTIDLWDLDKLFPSEDLFIVISRHESKSKIPIFSAHFTGMVDKEMIGYTYPSYHKEFLRILKSLNPKFEVTTEPMHHGPVISKPVMFVEVGSSEKEWKDKEAVNTLLKAVEKILKKKPKYKTIGIGIGGNHYSKKFTDLILNSDAALGPIISKYYIDYVTEESFRDMINKCVEKVQYVFVDKKCKKKKYINELSDLFGIEMVEV